MDAHFAFDYLWSLVRVCASVFYTYIVDMCACIYIYVQRCAMIFRCTLYV